MSTRHRLAEAIPPDHYAAASETQRRLLPRVVAATVLILALVAALLSATADAADEVQLQELRPFCDEPADAAKALKDTFGEVPAAIGVDTNDRLVSLFVDPDDGSWTVLLTVPGQHPISCVLTGGEGWQPMLMLKGDPA